MTTPAPTTQRNIKRLVVREIFGDGSHDVDISLCAGRMTILHGPNGCGKTTVLNILATLRWGGADLLSMPFRSLALETLDGVTFTWSNRTSTWTLSLPDGSMCKGSPLLAYSPVLSEFLESLPAVVVGGRLPRCWDRPDLDEAVVRLANARLAPKTVALRATGCGLQVRTPAGTVLKRAQLSTGETNYLDTLDTVRGAPRGALILIDGVEAGLHVGWQDTFLYELQALARMGDLQFIVTTQSPYFIGECDDLMVYVGPPRPPVEAT